MSKKDRKETIKVILSADKMSAQIRFSDIVFDVKASIEDGFYRLETSDISGYAIINEEDFVGIA